jgi:hypothetical protein
MFGASRESVTDHPPIEAVTFRPIGVIRTPFTSTAGMPIQATAAVGIPGWVELDPDLVARATGSA